MRNELTFPIRAANAAPDSDAWAIVGFCLAGLMISLYFTMTSLPLDEIPIMQYNLG